MTKEILLIFQDCYDCGANKDWYQKQAEKASGLGIKISPMPFNAPGAKGLILKAKNRGAAKMPFLTDGSNKFGYDVSKFVPKTATEKKATVTKRKVNTDGAAPENN